jgi:hypothetical protein
VLGPLIKRFKEAQDYNLLPNTHLVMGAPSLNLVVLNSQASTLDLPNFIV